MTDHVLDNHNIRRSESLIELAEKSEIFVVGLPPVPTTLEIINREVIFALPKGALFVLVTRMAVVEPEPLWERIRANELAAAIDVFNPEPPPKDAWFRRHPNVLVPPILQVEPTFAIDGVSPMLVRILYPLLKANNRHFKRLNGTNSVMQAN